MKQTVCLAGWALMVMLSACGGDDSDDESREECVVRVGEAMELAGAPPPPSTLMRMAPPEGPAERVDPETDETESDDAESAAEAEQNAAALCNDPPAGQERLVLQPDGTRRCAFGPRPEAVNFTNPPCE